MSITKRIAEELNKLPITVVETSYAKGIELFLHRGIIEDVIIRNVPAEKMLLQIQNQGRDF